MSVSYVQPNINIHILMMRNSRLTKAEKLPNGAQNLQETLDLTPDLLLPLSSGYEFQAKRVKIQEMFNSPFLYVPLSATKW